MKQSLNVVEVVDRPLKKRSKFRKYLPLYIMLIPFLLYYIVFQYKPLAGLVVAFQDYSLFKGIGGSDWVGLKHFETFFSSPYFARTFRNTIVLNLLSLVFSFPAPIIFALLLNEVRQKTLKKSIQTLTYAPYFISTVVIAGIVINMLSPSYGIITNFVEWITGNRIYFISSPKYFRTIYITMGIWQTLGYGSIVYISAISSVDQELYEAAVLDGANKFKQIIHVTIPSIITTIMTMLILRIGALLASATDSILLLYQPATYEVSDVIGTYVYREGLTNANYSYSTAVNLFNSVVGLILVAAANYASKKFTDYGLW